MNDHDPTRADLWADFLNPHADGPVTGSSVAEHGGDADVRLTASEEALLERTRIALAGPDMWSGPSAGSRAELLARAAAEPPATESGPDLAVVPSPGNPSLSRPSRSNRSRWLAVAATGAAAAVLVAVLAIPKGDDQPAVEYALAAADFAPEASGSVGVENTDRGVAITLVTDALPAAEAGTYYSGWVMGDGVMVPVGSFHLRDGAGPITLWSGVDLADYPMFVVTVQQEGEPPTPSGVVALRGRITS